MGVPVHPTVVDNPATDTILGANSFNDNSGDAFASVQTRRLVSGTIRIRATCCREPRSRPSSPFR